MSTSYDEQETIIQISRNCKLATVATSDTTMMTKLDKLAADADSDWTLSSTSYCQGDIAEKIYTAPKNLISFRKATSTRQLTEEQKQALADRLKAYRSNT